MSNTQHIGERIRSIMQDALELELPACNAHELHMDSMALLELIVGIEKEFGVEIREEELDEPGHFKNIESITAFVMHHMAG